MGKYTHDPAPCERAKQFIRWCAENIQEWREPYVSCARCIASKKNKWWKKNVTWCEHHNSLSHLWLVCTKRQWIEAREKLHDRP